jgi:hypothetical protein
MKIPFSTCASPDGDLEGLAWFQVTHNGSGVRVHLEEMVGRAFRIVVTQADGRRLADVTTRDGPTGGDVQPGPGEHRC